MVNCYIHTARQATGSCVICGRGICRECSNWAAGDIYLCPKCWQENAPAERKRQVTGPSTGAGLSRALYYVTALVIVVVASLYVFSTFIAPATLPPGVGPAGVLGFASSGVGWIWSRHSLLIAVSVGMFMIVLVGGELMLRTGPKQARAVIAKPQPQVRPAGQSVRDGPGKSQPVIKQPEVAFERPSRRESQPAVTHSEVQPLTQTVPARPKVSQPILAQPEPQPRTQTGLVYCIYCGNKIPSTAVACNKCGKAVVN